MPKAKAKSEARQLVDTSIDRNNQQALTAQEVSLYGTFTLFTGRQNQAATKGYTNPQATAQNIELEPRRKALLENLTIESKPTSESMPTSSRRP